MLKRNLDVDVNKTLRVKNNLTCHPVMFRQVLPMLRFWVHLIQSFEVEVKLLISSRRQ